MNADGWNFLATRASRKLSRQGHDLIAARSAGLLAAVEKEIASCRIA
jgi:hypothetical protein